ncbi:hypothetical protein FHL15_007689 [Xylaria flabelliformis]|uniref:TLDc domain-containing protein n=1 Tax=Xylaria flabelliformis TaxID=2512241 RepID=A0A553HU34_9PEZI|nr:hypothetical protein FHL15_007689 [Xylaria flabelliformis]
MSRLIDRLPAPKEVREKKVIVLSRSRIGTFSLYQALEMLGYTAYHMAEVVKGGELQMALFEEALRCKYLRAGKPYGKAEFDKWLAGYDEIPQFFIEEFIKFYPNARFILTERDLESWTKSMNNTARPMMTATRTFPLSAIRKVDPYVEAFCSLHNVLETIVYYGKTCDDAEGIEGSRRDTVDLSEKAKALVPKDRLLVARLEDGFGWEQICPFLGHPIPATRYPRGNAPEEFKKMGDEILVPRIQKAGLMALSTALIPVLGVGAWYYAKVNLKYGLRTDLEWLPKLTNHQIMGQTPSHEATHASKAELTAHLADKFARRCYEPLELYSFKDNFRSLSDREGDVRYLKEDTIARFLELPDILAVSPVIFQMVSFIGAFPFLQEAPVILGFEQMIMVVAIMTERYTKVLAKGATNRRKLLFKSLAVYDRKLSEIDGRTLILNKDFSQGGVRSHAPGFAVDEAGDDDYDDDDELVMAALDSLDINDAFKTGDSHAATTRGAVIPADNFRRLIMLLLLMSPLGPQESLSAYADRVTGCRLDTLRATAENVLSAFINVEKSPGITFAQFQEVQPTNFPYLFNGFNPLFEHFLFSKNLDLSKRRGSVAAPTPTITTLPPLLQDKGQILNLDVLSQLSFFIEGHDLFRRLRLLYSGADAGYSMGSFETKVFNWRAPTILLVSGTRLDDTESRRGSEGAFNDSLPPKRFPNGSGSNHDRLVFGVLVRQPWRVTNKECFGADDMVLFQLSPTHDVFRASSMNKNYAAFTKPPATHPGISFGSAPPPTSSSSRHAPLRQLGPVSLVLDSSFEFGVFHHDHTSRGGAFATSVSRKFDFQERFSIDDIEVWGCGGDEEARIQRERWEWEAREAEARRRVNLGTGDIEADRALLEMAGLIGSNRSGGSMA